MTSAVMWPVSTSVTLRLRTWSTWRFWSVRTLRRRAFRSGSRRTGSGAHVPWRTCQTAAWQRSREQAASPWSQTTTMTTRLGLWTTSENCRWRWDDTQVFSDRMWCQHYHRWQDVYELSLVQRGLQVRTPEPVDGGIRIGSIALLNWGKVEVTQWKTVDVLSRCSADLLKCIEQWRWRNTGCRILFRAKNDENPDFIFFNLMLKNLADTSKVTSINGTKNRTCQHKIKTK